MIWRFRLAVVLALVLFASILVAEPADADGGFELPSGSDADEMFFYRDDGLFAFYKVGTNGSLGTKLISGTGYTKGWDQITAVDLDGDDLDEMFFYREDGLFAFYKVRSDGSLASKLFSGTGYTKGWDQITSADLDGDGRDEMFFYRDDGLFAFYKVGTNGSLGTKLFSGTGYTKGWDQINAVDLNGDGRDEMFFYREDGLFAFYNVRTDGTLAAKLFSGTGYTKGWSSIAAVNIDLPPVTTSFGDGTWRVGSDIPSGTYRQATARSNCYWERLSGFSGSFDDIITNEFTHARQIVTVSPSDVGFSSNRCGTWSTLTEPLPRTPTASFGDGMYLVNYELAPGTWRNSDSSNGCYWERLSGFSGSSSDIITNDFTDNISTVTISSGDVGFNAERCGTWTYLGP